MYLEDLAKMIEDLRNTALFGGVDPLTARTADAVETAGLDPLAEQEFLAALAYLDVAHRAARKADLIQSRALASSPYRL